MRGAKTQENGICAIDDKILFGLVECDVRVLDEHKEKCAEMPPIFKYIEVSRNDTDAHMRDTPKKINSTVYNKVNNKVNIINTLIIDIYLPNTDWASFHSQSKYMLDDFLVL